MEALILNFLLSFRFLVLWFRSEKGFGLDWARNERKVECDYCTCSTYLKCICSTLSGVKEMRIEILPLRNRQREEHAYSAVPMQYVRSYLLYVQLCT